MRPEIGMNREETMNGSGLFFVLEDCGEVGGFSPLYAAETEQSSAEAGTSERNMDLSEGQCCLRKCRM